MSDSVIELIRNSGRPWKEVPVEFQGNKKMFYTRKLSVAEIEQLRSVYNREFTKIRDSMDEDSDISVLRRNFAKQPLERIAKFIVDADRLEYLQEASSELDDLPLNDKRVKERADTLAEENVRLLSGANKSELLDQAIERRAYITATLRANELQQQYLLMYVLYDEAKKPLFNDVEEIQTLDNETINYLINEAQKALGETKDSPLPPAPTKPSRKRTSSRNSSVEEQKDS